MPLVVAEVTLVTGPITCDPKMVPDKLVADKTGVDTWLPSIVPIKLVALLALVTYPAVVTVGT